MYVHIYILKHIYIYIYMHTYSPRETVTFSSVFGCMWPKKCQLRGLVSESQLPNSDDESLGILEWSGNPLTWITGKPTDIISRWSFNGCECNWTKNPRKILEVWLVYKKIPWWLFQNLITTLTWQIHNEGDVNVAVLPCHCGDHSK